MNDSREPARRPETAHARAASAGRPLAGVRVVVDCRWLALRVGATRVIELLLADVGASPPPGEWILWGRPDLVRPFLFEGAAIAATSRDPRAWAGQREILAVPAADVVLYTHQIRPLRPGPSVTIVHDTIPLRYGGGAVSRLAKHALLRATASLSSEILTDSDFSKSCIVRDLGVPASRISVMRFPVEAERTAAIARLRASLGQEDRLLYVGRFLPHKNLRRLCVAFGQSRFAERGGTLTLVGGWNGEVDALRAWVDASEVDGVEVRPACPDAELDRLMATSRALVLPSLEEGYGLTAFEAAASGLPVAASRTGALTELGADRAVLFEPVDVAAMRDAIDEATARPPQPPMVVETNLRDVVLDAVGRVATSTRRERAHS